MSGISFDDRPLACPACRARLELEANRVVCSGCGRVYPIREGIPVLLLDEATLPGKPPAARK
jgi:uncharacterized protein